MHCVRGLPLDSCSCARARGMLGEDSGQAVVEAAFALPILMLLILLLVQPGIVLYDRIIMQSAAAEGCRLLATAQAEGVSLERCEDYIRRRLGAIPQQDCFHAHGEACSWNIVMTGGGASSQVTVRIENEIKPLPLLDGASGLLGLTNDEGNLTVSVEATMPAQPAWVASTELQSSPSSWLGAWSHEG